jgi:GMP synthase-like glutamine amidotransferase
MAFVLILGLYNKDKYNERLCSNLEHYNIQYDVINYYDFSTIDFSKYTHIILTGSDFYVYKGELALTKKQVDILVKCGKPILAECYGFQLLAYYTNGKDSVGEFSKKRYGCMKLNSPIVRSDGKYFMNHWNYVKELGDNWDVISYKTILDSDGSRITFILDAVMKRYPILGIQYHPEFSKNTYDFIYNWIG